MLRLLPFLLAIVTSMLIAFFPLFLPHQMPLFYSLPWGESQIASSRQFFIIPFLIALISLVNLSLSSQLHPNQDFFKKTLLFCSIISSMILTVTLIKIVLIFI